MNDTCKLNSKLEGDIDFLEENFKKLNLENENFQFRLLDVDDYDKNYFELLSQLTVANKPDYNLWLARFQEIKEANLTKIFVVENLSDNLIIATITCYTELKFIRNLGKICHIEDFVINENFRNKKLGSKLISTVIEYAKSIGCYKVVLESRDDALLFYEKFGFTKNSQSMACYLNKEK